MKGEYEELMTFKEELEKMSRRSSIPFVNMYRRMEEEKYYK